MCVWAGKFAGKACGRRWAGAACLAVCRCGVFRMCDRDTRRQEVRREQAGVAVSSALVGGVQVQRVQDVRPRR